MTIVGCGMWFDVDVEHKIEGEPGDDVEGVMVEAVHGKGARERAGLECRPQLWFQKLCAVIRMSFGDVLGRQRVP